MKNLLLLTIYALSATAGTGQTVEFFTNEVRGLDKTLTLQGPFGRSTVTTNLWLANRTQQPLRIYARPHMDGDALYFTDTKGVTSREYALEIAPGTRIALPVFGFLDKGNARTCRGYLALATTPLNADGSKGMTRTVKLPVALNFEGGKSKTDPQPAPDVVKNPSRPFRYEVIMQDGLPMRWHLRHLPLKIYSDYTGDNAAQYVAVVRRAVDVWNGAARENGLDRDFFKIVSTRGQADIRLDWTGKRLLSGAQGTAYPSDGLIGMLPLDRYRGLGPAGETLLQELGHMLGVAHSMVWEDMMFEGVHSYNIDLSKLRVTARDKQMMGWLYSQTQYAPLRK